MSPFRMTLGFGSPTLPRPQRHAPRMRFVFLGSGGLPAASFRSHLAVGTLAVRLGVPVIKASKGLSPSSHFPVGFRLPVDSAVMTLRAMPGAHRVGGRVAPPVPPHHRAYGSVHGGSCGPLHSPVLMEKGPESPLFEASTRLLTCRVHVRGSGIPPVAPRPVAVALLGPPGLKPSAISFRRYRVLGLRHCSHRDFAQAPTHPLIQHIEVLSFHTGESKVAEPPSGETIDFLDHLRGCFVRVPAG